MGDIRVERPSEIPMPKNTGVKSAGKGLNPQWNSEAYRSNPFWDSPKRKKQEKRRD